MFSKFQRRKLRSSLPVTRWINLFARFGPAGTKQNWIKVCVCKNVKGDAFYFISLFFSFYKLEDIYACSHQRER